VSDPPSGVPAGAEREDAALERGPFLLHRNKGREHFEAHEYARARRHLELAHRLRPDEEEVLYWLAMTYFRLDAYRPAEELFRRLLELRPDVATLHVNRGIVLYKMGRAEEAEGTFRRALELDATANRPHLYLGLLRARGGDHPGALRCFERAGAEVLAARMRARMREEASGGGSADPLPEVGAPASEAAPGASAVGIAEPAPPNPGWTAAGLPGLAVEPVGAPVRGEAVFRAHGKYLVHVAFAEELLVRAGAVAGSAGELSFEASSEEGEILRARGEGEVILVGEGRRISVVELSGGVPFHLELGHFVACERRLRRELVSLGRRDGLGLRVVALHGRGLVAMASGGAPAALPVRRDRPVSVSADLLVGWHGALEPTLLRQGGMEDRAIRGGGGALKLRFRGEGRLLVDRRREDGP
jgi:uncharacterized protein (AIM24 family)